MIPGFHPVIGSYLKLSDHYSLVLIFPADIICLQDNPSPKGAMLHNKHIVTIVY